MKFRFFIPAFVALTLISLNLNAQPGIVIDSVAPAQTGQTVCVPVITKGFVDVITMQGSISWNPQVIDFDKTQNYYPIALTSSNFNYPQGGQLLFSWADPSASCLSVDDDEVLFEICFSVIGPAGSGSDIEIDTAIIWSCLFEGNLWTYVASPPIYFNVAIATDISNLAASKQPMLTLSPNPTSSGTQLRIQSQNGDEAMLLVTNTLGQTVLKQKVSIEIGENQIQIPTEVLQTAGVYQVSLQTEQGTISRLLLVD